MPFRAAGWELAVAWPHTRGQWTGGGAGLLKRKTRGGKLRRGGERTKKVSLSLSLSFYLPEGTRRYSGRHWLSESPLPSQASVSAYGNEFWRCCVQECMRSSKCQLFVLYVYVHMDRNYVEVNLWRLHKGG